jgi:hypothetical protein
VAEIITSLRAKPRSALLLWGFGPALVALVLVVLMLLLTPSVAPERVVTKPVNATTTTNPKLVP